MGNEFTKAATTEARTFTENGDGAFVTIGSKLMDQFGMAGTFRGRPIDDVFQDQDALWLENPAGTLRLMFYLRCITRNTNDASGKPFGGRQKGQGNKDESLKRMLWLAKNHPKTFMANWLLIPAVGSWKDVWTLLYMDRHIGVEAFSDEMRNRIYREMATVDDQLARKYMPRIKSLRKCTTERSRIMNELAREYAEVLGLDLVGYNRFKSSGTAHKFQQQITRQEYNEIDWGRVPGKALSLIIASKFITKHKLTDKFIKWVESVDFAKFTGQVYELYFAACNATKKFHKILINKQFDNIVRDAASDEGGISENVWCAVDTSGSMESKIGAGKLRAIDVCVSLSLMFASMNKGAFHKNIVMFDDTSKPLQLEGDFCDMVDQIRKQPLAMGSTNFMSVAAALANVRKNHPEIPLSDYPTTLLVISDMQFNGNIFGYERQTTSHERTIELLRTCFPDEYVDSMKFIWWNCSGRLKNFPANSGTPGNYFFSGFDPSVVSILLGEDSELKKMKKETGVEPSLQDVIDASLGQKIFDRLKILD